MSKTYKYLLLISLLSICFSCSSSKDDPEPEPNPSESANAKTNKWILEQLNDVYYWSDALRTGASQELSPDEYFYTTISRNDQLARFSYIESSAASTRGDANGNITDFGMQLTRWTYGKNTARNTLQVLYVVPDSPAEKAGIQRGDHFTHYNGTMIDSLNYGNIYSLSTVKLTRCNDNLEKIDDVTVSKGQYYDTPVICDTVYNINGRNIGYLYYARFESARGTTDDIDLKAAVARIKEKNVDDLILDLRLNGGGYLKISVELATMLLPAGYGKNDIYLYQEYSPKQTTQIYPVNFSGEVDAYRLNLDRLHIITSNYTASASEITPHGLAQYMDVILYGKQTVGKNVGSYAIESKDHPWILHPISSRLYDKRGKGVDNWQTFVGFTPDYYFDEVDGGYFFYTGDLGEYDPEKDCDPMLNFVMNKIDPSISLLHRERGTRSGGITPVPFYIPTKPQVLITDMQP